MALALGGCGGGKSGVTTAPATLTPTTTASVDPGKAVIDAFALAAHSERTAAMWELLSTASKERLGPTLKEFEGKAVKLTRELGTFERFKVIVSERITPEFGVVAIDGKRLVTSKAASERAVYALALRLEGKKWKVELGGPVKVRPIGPVPNAREQVVAQVAAAVEGPGGAGTAVMYVDGQTVSPHVAGTATNSTLYANFEPALDPGRHTVVLFAADGREASATGWAFSVEKK